MENQENRKWEEQRERGERKGENRKWGGGGRENGYNRRERPRELGECSVQNDY